MGITFRVDDVTPATERLAEREVSLSPLSRLGLLGRSHDAITLVSKGIPQLRAFGGAPGDRLHALVHSVELAFNEHRPLRLTPDAVWITLAQGFSLHVRENAEALRARFVRHEGKKTLSTEVTEIPRGTQWRGLIADLSARMRDDLGPGVVAMLTNPFSTTDEDALTVFRITLMETFEEYFEYELTAVCGIPEVTLDGSPEDWRDLARRVEVMGEYDLRWWTDVLLPVCQQLVATAEGRPDRTFWQAIYRPAQVYGGALITGWLAWLFPYVEGPDGRLTRNDLSPVRRIPEDAVKPVDWMASTMRLVQRQKAAREGVGELVPWAHLGVSPRSLPASWSRAEIKGAGLLNDRSFCVSGGLLGVTQSPDGTALSPAIVWQAEETPESLVWRRLEREHEAVSTATEPPVSGYRQHPLRGAMLAFYRRFSHASLFHGALQIEARDRVRDSPSSPYEHPLWQTLDLWTFARVGEHGALAWLSRKPLNRPELAWMKVSDALPYRLDWVVHIPDVRTESLDAHRVIALDAWSFFVTLIERPTPYFLDPSDTSARLLDLVRG